MNGRALEYALLHAFALAELVPFNLQYDAEAFEQEYAAQYGYEQLLVNDDG